MNSNLMTRIFILFFLLITTQKLPAQKKEQKEVAETFNKYREAILNDRGEEAVSYVDSRTIQYYSGILQLVRTADSLAVEKLSILDRLMVFSIRHRATKEEISGFDGRSLVVYAIRSGMVGKSSVSTSAIGEVSIDGDFAKGRFIAGKQTTPFYFHFYREEGRWKIDLTSLFAVSTTAFNKMAEDSGLPANEFLFSLLEMITGHKPGPGIWQPVD